MAQAVPRTTPIQLRVGADLIEGDLFMPAGASGLVVFAHGSGSSRFSSRNRAVALVLYRAGYAAWLLDLLTREGSWRRCRPAASAPAPAPPLLIVGGADEEVIVLNRSAMGRMHATVELAIVPGATHLFEEPGALEEVSRLATGWCQKHLRRTREPTP